MTSVQKQEAWALATFGEQSVLAQKLEREEDKKPQPNVQGSCGYDLSAY